MVNTRVCTVPCQFSIAFQMTVFLPPWLLGLSAEAAELPFQFGLLILETLQMGLQIRG